MNQGLKTILISIGEITYIVTIGFVYVRNVINTAKNVSRENKRS